MPLKNTKHEIFVQEVAKGSSAQDAYMRAYPETSASNARKNATRLTANDDIRRRIEEIQSQAAQECGVTVRRIVEELAKIGFSNISDYINGSDGNISFVDLDDLTREQSAAISEITIDTLKRQDKRTGDVSEETLRVKFKLHDKRAALVDLGKHLGMFKDKMEHGFGPGDLPSKITISFTDAAKQNEERGENEE